MRAAFPILLLAAAAPLPGAAQPVVGTVVEEGTGMPVPGAMVILFDSTETRVARTLTDPIGRFLLRARHPGSHYVTVQRIGYADWTTDLFEPAPDGEFLTIRIPVQAIPIEGLDVSGGRRCEVRPEEGLATARVWEEVRKALAAEEYTREASLYRYALLVYRRQLDRNARKTLDGTSTMLEDQQAAFRSFPIEHLVDRGFVQMVADSAVYFAPDAGALLSDAFLDTHRLELREGEEGREERIGLAFRPLDDRDVPEVAGVGGAPGGGHDGRVAMAARLRAFPPARRGTSRSRRHAGPHLDLRARRLLRYRHDHNRLAGDLPAVRRSRRFAPPRERAGAGRRRSGVDGNALRAAGRARRGGEPRRSGFFRRRAAAGRRRGHAEPGRPKGEPRRGLIIPHPTVYIGVGHRGHTRRRHAWRPGFAQDMVSRPMSNPRKRR